MSGEPELGVVCRNCGAEVSAFVTECPYCGQRLRKRAPKLRRVDGEMDFEPPKPRRRRIPRPSRPSRPSGRRIPSLQIRDGLPLAVIAVLAAASILVVVQRAAGLSVLDVGAAVGDSPDPWRYLTSPFVYEDLGYLFAAGLGIAIFGTAVERRIGTVPALLLLIACGSLGVLAAGALQDDLVAIGQNGAALGALGAWTAFARREEHAYEEDEPDWLAVGIAAAVLVVIPVVEESADLLAGLVGGAVGLLMGEIAARSRAGATG